ncbi:hypothetical protein N7520_004219 [Penicillium odoratum]|uniref:uncharacterized protein n=1 Tax=Penicillium odoratum TaxID=1167516 RepID=UPI0025496B91|nr:uncharacterized protein N7520_004219 [Penicillium odoratum]KAJ5769660.1 hypothetical protein N7520_004219 [Penicillium odoratum]
MTSPSSTNDVLCQPESTPESTLSEGSLGSYADMKDAMEYEFECDFDHMTSEFAKEVEEIKSNLMESLNQREKIMETVFSMHLPVVPSSFETRFVELGIGLALENVMDCLHQKLLPLAKKEAKRALHLAEHQGDEINIARCYYWMGRIELYQRNISSAYKFFMTARPCVMDDKHPEGRSLGYYLSLFNPGAGGTISHPNHDAFEATLIKGDMDQSGDNQSRKRKQDAQTSELVLRPFNMVGHTKLGSVTMKSPQYPTSRPVVWITQITEDALHSDSPMVIILKDEANADGMDWLATANSGPRLSQIKFTFRCYPRGLAPRTRPTEIFAEQPGENLLSAEEWQALHQHAKNKKVTLAYLADERRRNLELTKKTIQLGMGSNGRS